VNAMPAYWVARAKVNNPAEYKKYADQTLEFLSTIDLSDCRY